MFDTLVPKKAVISLFERLSCPELIKQTDLHRCWLYCSTVYSLWWYRNKLFMNREEALAKCWLFPHQSIWAKQKQTKSLSPMNELSPHIWSNYRSFNLWFFVVNDDGEGLGQLPVWHVQCHFLFPVSDPVGGTDLKMIGIVLIFLRGVITKYMKYTQVQMIILV